MKTLYYLIALSAAASATRTYQDRLVSQLRPGSASGAQAAPPIVTLPYEKHQAIFNVIAPSFTLYSYLTKHW